MSRIILKYCSYVGLGMYVTVCTASGVAGVQLLQERKSLCDADCIEIAKSFNSGVYAMHLLVAIQAYLHYKQAEEIICAKLSRE